MNHKVRCCKLSQNLLIICVCVCCLLPPQKCTVSPPPLSLQLPPYPALCTRTSHGWWKRAVRTHSHTSLFHHQLSPFSSTHSSSPLPLSPPPLPALASFSIHRSPPPLSLGPGHMREGRLGRCSSEKKREGKNALLLFLQAGPPL